MKPVSRTYITPLRKANDFSKGVKWCLLVKEPKPSSYSLYQKTLIVPSACLYMHTAVTIHFKYRICNVSIVASLSMVEWGQCVTAHFHRYFFKCSKSSPTMKWNKNLKLFPHFG